MPDPDRFVLLLRRLGIGSPEEWVDADLAGGEPEIATALFLHEVRQRLVGLYEAGLGVAVTGAPPPGGVVPPPEAVAERGDEAARCLLDAGADPADLARVARGAAAATAITFAAMLDRVLPPLADEAEGAPCWALAETVSEADDALTGRYVTDVHASLNELYASDSD